MSAYRARSGADVSVGAYSLRKTEGVSVSVQGPALKIVQGLDVSVEALGVSTRTGVEVSVLGPDLRVPSGVSVSVRERHGYGLRRARSRG